MAMVLGFSLFHMLGCTPAAGVRTSDPFNGKKFHNPAMTEAYSPGFSSVLKMLASPS